MVTGLAYDITVPSVVSLTFVHRELVMMMGRINGPWWHRWLAGPFYCLLSNRPLGSPSDYGAITSVSGRTGGNLAGKYITGGLCSTLNVAPSWPYNDRGAKERRGGITSPHIIFILRILRVF